MKPRFLPRAPGTAPAAGFSLVEVALALGIAAFALVALFGLLPVGLNSNRAAAEQNAAVNVASGLIADMRQTPTAAGIAAGAAATPPVVLKPFSPTRLISLNGTGTTVYYLDEGGGPYVQPGDKTATPPTTLQPDSRYRVTVTLTQPPATSAKTATLANVLITWPAPALPVNATGSVTLFVALDRN